METPSGTPPAIKTLWYADNVTGREFIYPKQEARRLAKATNAPVLTTKAETATPEQMPTAELERVLPTGETQAAAATPLLITPVGPAQQGAPAPVTQLAQLPKTASLMPFVGMLGPIAVLMGAMLLGKVRS